MSYAALGETVERLAHESQVLRELAEHQCPMSPLAQFVDHPLERVGRRADNQVQQ